MNLIDKINAALAAKDAGQFSALREQADNEFVALRASGQTNYIKTVEGLLDTLSKLPKTAKAVVHTAPSSFANLA